MFHSTKIAPGTWPWVENMISVISATPASPEFPTLNTALGESYDWNCDPVAASTDQASPTILEPAGTKTVEVIR